MSTETMRLVRSRGEARYGFRVHLALYVALNIMLLGFNVLTGAPWWAVWILCGWGVVVVAHGVAALVGHGMPPGRLFVVGGAVLLTAGTAQPAYAHCDSMDGPVVKAAQKALETGNINHALIWVAPADEANIRTAFRRTLTVRKQSPSARELADLWFFETLVRVHRQAEGAPYTGLKPAGQERHPAVEAADSALTTGSVTDLNRLLAQAIHDGLRERFHSALARRNFNVNDLGRGRAYVQAYVPLIHYAEAVYDLARQAGAHEHVTAVGR